MCCWLVSESFQLAIAADWRANLISSFYLLLEIRLWFLNPYLLSVRFSLNCICLIFHLCYSHARRNWHWTTCMLLVGNWMYSSSASLARISGVNLIKTLIHYIKSKHYHLLYKISIRGFKPFITRPTDGWCPVDLSNCLVWGLSFVWIYLAFISMNAIIYLASTEKRNNATCFSSARGTTESYW